MTRYYVLPLATRYWKPGTDYIHEVVKDVAGKAADGDYVVVSEKAISTSENNLIDESTFKPSSTARFLATVWMHIAWGYTLGILCGFGQRLLRRLRNYPAEEGSRHKQAALQYAGFSQALMFGSEGGIDGSNLPYSLVSLPLKDAQVAAEKIRQQILKGLSKKVTVVIVDTDKTYSFRNFHFTPRPKPMNGIQSFGGTSTYVVGRVLGLRRRPTPLAVVGEKLSVEEALTVANVADRARGPGLGATVWDMAARLKVSETAVTWDMLMSVKHKPIVVVRRARTHSELQRQQNR
ncbi:MAG: coenzyme F420-0:L-glutamate ligase [Candidatus Bathyarchaeota archaeon]|nr:coenzyme F420-0:L-glutamate ligase [Candidatus Bathyarchaeota archaeon]